MLPPPSHPQRWVCIHAATPLLRGSSLRCPRRRRQFQSLRHSSTTNTPAMIPFPFLSLPCHQHYQNPLVLNLTTTTAANPFPASHSLPPRRRQRLSIPAATPTPAPSLPSLLLPPRNLLPCFTTLAANRAPARSSSRRRPSRDTNPIPASSLPRHHHPRSTTTITTESAGYISTTRITTLRGRLVRSTVSITMT
jgi:hypothetical protein